MAFVESFFSSSAHKRRIIRFSRTRCSLAPQTRGDRDPLERELNENMINKQSALSLFRWNGIPLSGGAGGDGSLPRDALFARMGARCGQLSEKPQIIHWNYESNSTSFIETGSRRYHDFIKVLHTTLHIV